MNKGLLYKLRCIRKRYWIISVGVIVLIITLSLFNGENPDKGLEVYVVERVTLSESIEETGVVEAAEDAHLSFKISGQVASINVHEGDKISKGDILATLDNAEARADVLSAEAEVRSKEAELADLLRSSTLNNGKRLAIIRSQQDALVENAYRELLSEGLEVEASNSSYTQTAPVVTGRYLGPEGRYKIIVESGTQITDQEVSVFGIESVRDVKINDTGQTPLGTKGLYIQFGDAITTYVGTTWYLDIPNTRSSAYLANYSAYLAALEAREVAIENEIANDDNLIVAEASLLKAKAALAKAQAAYNNAIVRAPFVGVVTSVDASVGEAVSLTDPIVSVISDSNYEITVLVPEADIANLNVGDEAVVTFDAYDDEEFLAEVVFVTPSAETVEGVPVFEATLVFKEQDERIRVGLSADVEIFAEERESVFAVPSRAVIRETSGSYVRLLVDDDHIERVKVVTGLRSSEGLLEIISGLEEGDQVITYIDADTLEKLGGE